MRTGNPVLKNDAFPMQRHGATMSLSGTVGKIALLFVLLCSSAGYTWLQFFQGEEIQLLVYTGAIGGLIVALITVFAPKAAPVTAPIYAILEGLFIGGISAIFESQYPGIVIQAATLTLAVMGALLLLYVSRLIKVTRNFRLMVMSATLGILLVYLAHFILNVFFNSSIPYLHDSGPIGIGISLFIVVIAALNLVLDFDFIEEGVNRGAPKHLEWYGAFGLMVTLVWLYIEILRLLSKLRR